MSNSAGPAGDLAAQSQARFLAGLLTLSLLMGLSIGFSRVATTLYALQLDARGWQLAAVAFTQGIGMLMLGLLAGRWVSAYGPRPVFVFGTAWGALVYIAMPLVPQLWALLLFSAAASLAMPLRFVSVNTVFMSRLGELGQQRAGWFRAAHVIGMSFLGAVLAAALFPAVDAIVVFWLAAAIFLLNVAVLLGAFTREDLSRPASPGGAPAPAASGVSVRRVAFQEFAIQSLNAYYAFYIVVIVVRDLRLPPATAGFAVAVQGIVFVGTLVTFGAFVLKYRKSSPLIGTAAVMLALAGLVVAQRPAGLFAAASLLGFGLGLLQIINLTQFAQLGARIGYARAASLNALSGPSGGLVGGAVGGMLESWLSPQLAFCVFLPLFLLLGLWREAGGGTPRTPSPQ